ncbi:Crp/Fnr family transcriptional regulator [Salidesulfovibrio onnuriiensis]|uniref:Crp/Fnr family transcriptional regulator n=1 Tax=Salidesulfovibrio onnuriiensis TaxID=2583823 RepID=UPI0011C9CF50|nr:Crp/Fnr family transcriptional regulator [Salidesulfovibrio onnuriiensis]
MKSIPTELAQNLLAAYRRMRKAPGDCMEKDMKPGETLIRQGESPQDVFLILDGRIKIHHGTPKGSEYLVAVEGPGEIIGEVEALTGERYTCSATAVKASRVAVIPRAAYGQWLERDHGFSLLVNQVLSHRLQEATKRSAIHLTYPLEYSVLRLLSILAEENGGPRLAVGKEELANYLGTHTRSINRILKDLQHKGVLKPSREIEIASMEELERAMQARDQA